MRTTDLLTYRHPRTAAEAFGCDVDSAYAVEHYRAGFHPLAKWALAALAAAWFLWHIVEGFA